MRFFNGGPQRPPFLVPPPVPVAGRVDDRHGRLATPAGGAGGVAPGATEMSPFQEGAAVRPAGSCVDDRHGRMGKSDPAHAGCYGGGGFGEGFDQQGLEVSPNRTALLNERLVYFEFDPGVLPVGKFLPQLGDEAVRHASIWLVASHAQFGCGGPQSFLPAQTKRPFPVTARIVEQTNIDVANLAVQHRRETVHAKMNHPTAFSNRTTQMGSRRIAIGAVILFNPMAPFLRVKLP